MKHNKTSLADLEKMAANGSHGFYANKCYSGLMKSLPVPVQIPQMTVGRLPFQGGKWLQQAFLLPHELFSCIYHSFPDTWAKCMVPAKERLQSFWRSNREHPAMAASDLPTKEGYDHLAVPISMHGDDVPITGIGKSWAALMTVFSWSSMVGTGTTADMQWFIYGCFEKKRVIDEDQSKDTMGVFFKILQWSLHWLYRGLWPDRDWLGRV